MDANLVELWEHTLHQLEQDLPRPSFETWLRNTQPLSLSDNILSIGVPNEFARDWLEKRYSSLLTSALKSQVGEDIQLRFIIPDAPDNTSSAARGTSPEQGFSASSRLPLPVSSNVQQLNPKYTFDSFVIGASNRFAHAAALAVASSPARAYNPLFVYGGVGLGKTHLMHAIGHHVLAQGTPMRVVYVTSETFTNELINAIRDHQTINFRNRYRSIDVLLIDDIQFLAGKESTQEEFFHTFNSLSAANKQIVVSSDRPPKEIPTLEERLRSRFEGGLIADMQAPDLETRIAILRKKAGVETVPIPDDVLLYIATKIDTNIRELEGALIRLVAFASLSTQPVTLQLAGEALRDILPGHAPQSISVELIQRVVADHYGISVSDLKVRKRTRALAFPRQIAMYLARQLTDSSLPRLGEEFGGRDHTTVLHACDKISNDIDRDPALHAIIQQLTDTIRGR